MIHYIVSMIKKINLKIFNLINHKLINNFNKNIKILNKIKQKIMMIIKINSYKQFYKKNLIF